MDQGTLAGIRGAGAVRARRREAGMTPPQSGPPAGEA